MIGCVGDAVLDVSVRLTASARSGTDAEKASPRLSVPDPRLTASARSGTDTPARIQTRRGGSAANVAAEAARLSGKSRFIGVIGADPTGDLLASELQNQGVELCGPRSGRTGCVVALLNEAGEATMLTDRGDAAQLSKWSPKWLDGLTALHVTSYAFFAEPMATTAKSLIAEAQTQDIHVSIDVSSVGAISDFGLARYAELLHDLQPDILFATAAEAELLVSEKGLISRSPKGKSPNPTAAALSETFHEPVSQSTGLAEVLAGGPHLSETFHEPVSQSPKGKSPNPQTDPSEKHSEVQTADILLSLAKTIVIKQGPNPVILLNRDPQANDKTRLEIPVPKLEKVTDTLAAGDTFAAGFLVAKTIQGHEWHEATTAAINAAADLLSRRS